ncbi:MAG TPA: hypothetical protein PLJ60_01910 [Chryseolinea sp.]|nr:hypothetical protein [Chryseolinea sp.]HPM29064.1 hypothetical protein [Chryseolinea sp.]
MRKFLFIATLVVISFHAHASVKKVLGTIISKGQSKDVMFEIKVAFLMLGEPNFERLQYKIKYFDENGKKHNLRPDDADEIRFRYEGENIRMISCPNAPGMENLFSASTRIFLKLEIEGPLRLYRFYRKQTTAPGYPGGYSVTSVTENLIFQKGNGPLKQPRALGWKKDMIEYFNDCPALGERIQSKDLGKKEIEAIVIYYNQKCGTK